MKRLTIIFLSISCLIAGCNLTDKSDFNDISVDMIDPEHPPVFEFETLAHDFGNVAKGEKLTFAFEFKNVGESPLLIHSATPSCNCTVLKNWPRQPIAPGESGTITAQFEGKYDGSNTKTISVAANTIPNITKLTLNASVVGAK
ncbi:MAG: hypothetical protein ACI9J3_004149 [Parvicellaceae bacterium]|jgi:hypothetical protein